MNCHEAGIWLGAYADGHVGALRRYSIQRHLRACTGCAEKHQGLLALCARLRAEAPYFKAPPELRGRVSFERADASRLPFEDGAFDLVLLANMIPFFDELARVTAPGGTAVFSFSLGPETPIYVPRERLRSELARRGFSEFADFSAGAGTALVARKV